MKIGRAFHGPVGPAVATGGIPPEGGAVEAGGPEGGAVEADGPEGGTVEAGGPDGGAVGLGGPDGIDPPPAVPGAAAPGAAGAGDSPRRAEPVLPKMRFHRLMGAFPGNGGIQYPAPPAGLEPGPRAYGGR